MSRTKPKALTAIHAALARGRKDYVEGVPGNLNPYAGGRTVLAQAWLTGWWTGFRDYPPNRADREV